MSIFTPRTAFKPFEYPEVVSYKNAINHSYWLVTEWNFASDVQDFYVSLSPIEREAIKRTLLAIAQIEIAVKRFWSQVGTRFPKAEIEQVGITLAENEIRHADAYSHLLEVLGLNGSFEEALKQPVISGRMNYLKKYLNNDITDQDYVFSLTLFTIFTEYVSLFSQFLIIKSFSQGKNALKDIDNVVQATLIEENLHAQFGFLLLRYLKEEFPQWFDEEFYKKLRAVALKAFKAESAIIDYIFEEGELSFLSKDTIKEFIKSRINESVVIVGGECPFVLDEDLLSPVNWFEEEFHAEVSTDFFHKKPVAYSKMMQSFNEGDLF